MSKHTPGRWSVTADGLVQGGERPIARLVSASLMAGSITEREANARLIVAAPDLLEALRLVTDALNDPAVGDYEQWKRDCKIATHKARAAIAKAEGVS